MIGGDAPLATLCSHFLILSPFREPHAFLQTNFRDTGQECPVFKRFFGFRRCMPIGIEPP